MQFIDIPKYNEDGSVDGMWHIAPEEAKNLLAFAINFLASAGLSTVIAVGKPDEERKFDD